MLFYLYSLDGALDYIRFCASRPISSTEHPIPQDAALPNISTPAFSPVSQNSSNVFDVKNTLSQLERFVTNDIDFRQNWDFFKSCCIDLSGSLSNSARTLLEIFHEQKKLLSKEDMGRFWESCKVSFTLFCSYDQGKILIQAAEKNEWDFVANHLDQGQHVFDNLLQIANGRNQEIVDIIMSVLLSQGNWSRLDGNFRHASDRVKVEIAQEARHQKKANFLARHRHEIPQAPKLSGIRREHDDMSDCELPTPAGDYC